MAGAGAAVARVARSPGLSTNPAIIRRNVLRKVKRGIDRLPSQGPDPAVSARTPNGWRIAAAAVLERYPTVMPEPHEFESKYLRGRFIWQSSVARPAAEELFKSEREGVADAVSSDEATAAMYEPGPIRTQADERNDTKSLDRALRERLYFVTKRTAKSSKFAFPQTLVTSESVSMREYAELALEASFPPGEHTLRPHFFSNMPAAHLEHVYGDEYQTKTGFYGLKMFFYRAQLIGGDMGRVSVADYAWARESELPQLLSEETFRAVDPILFGVGNDLSHLNIKYEEGEDAAKW